MTNPNPSRPTRDKEATKLRLVNAVGSVLAREGFSGLGVNSVAKEAGVDKVLIYRYFGGMTELLGAFSQSNDFWPSIEEVIGEDQTALMERPLAERWATHLSRYAAALRRRPITKEILAWEQVERNELTAVLQRFRERWFEELATHFPDDSAATDADLLATVLLITGGIHYFIVLSRLQGDFSGLDIESDEGWQHISSVIAAICERTFTEAKE